MDFLKVIRSPVNVLLNAIGTLLNALLIFVVIKKTPKILKTYSILVLNFAICDFMACISFLFTDQRNIVKGLTLFYVWDGLCCHVGARACSVLVNIWLHCNTHALYILLLSFCYRYYILIYPTPRIRTIIAIILLIYTPSGVQLVLSYFAMKLEGVAREELAKASDVNIGGKCVGAYLSLLEWKSFIITLHLFLPALPVYTAILIVRRSITLKLRFEYMSERSVRLHSQLLKALTYQACLPMLFVVSMLMFVVEHFDLLDNLLYGYSSTIMGLIPIINPMLSLYFIKPYREWTISKVTCNKKAAPVINVSSTVG